MIESEGCKIIGLPKSRLGLSLIESDLCFANKVEQMAAEYLALANVDYWQLKGWLPETVMIAACLSMRLAKYHKDLPRYMEDRLESFCALLVVGCGFKKYESIRKRISESIYEKEYLHYRAALMKDGGFSELEAVTRALARYVSVDIATIQQVWISMAKEDCDALFRMEDALYSFFLKAKGGYCIHTSQKGDQQ